MANEDAARVLKLLEKLGYEGTVKEFEAALDKFKAHPEALKALRKGVARQGREEDSGSYCENASSGYDRWWKKNDLLEKIDLADDRAFLDGATTRVFDDAAARPKKGAESLDALREQVRELTERVALLEKRAIRGPSLSPKEP